jgi:hypothetical protein
MRTFPLPLQPFPAPPAGPEPLPSRPGFGQGRPLNCAEAAIGPATGSPPTIHGG